MLGNISFFIELPGEAARTIFNAAGSDKLGWLWEHLAKIPRAFH